MRRKLFIKSIKDPRQGILKAQHKPEIDEETQAMAEAGYTIVSYHEHISQSDEVVTSEELRYCGKK